MLRLRGLTLRVDRLFVEEDGVVVRLTSQLPIRPTSGILPAPLRILWQARARALEAHDLRALSWADLLATVRTTLAIPPLLGELRLRYIPGAALAVGRLRLVLGLLGRTARFLLAISASWAALSPTTGN